MITWKQQSSYEWVGTDENQQYWISVTHYPQAPHWEWSVSNCGESMTIIEEYDDSETAPLTAQAAMADAEKALQAYLDDTEEQVLDDQDIIDRYNYYNNTNY